MAAKRRERAVDGLYGDSEAVSEPKACNRFEFRVLFFI